MYNKNKTSKYNFQNFRSKIICLLAIFFIPFLGQAQCAMCRAALQGEGNQSQAAAVNDGIIYLMIIPYILVAAVGFYVYQSRKKRVK